MTGAVAANLAFVAGAAVIAACLLCRPAPPALDTAPWLSFAERFIDEASGRVVDPENQGISHSEGQGYGMLLAEAAEDRKSFRRIWDWTRLHLQRPDSLFSWRFDAQGVSDRNNASDGDILIAWALLRAADRWGDPAYRKSAEAIIQALEDKMVVRLGGRVLLLPGEEGFRGDGFVVVNLSYWVFPALRRFAEVRHEALWLALAESGRLLLREARFGAFGLPPDWLRVEDDGVRPAPDHPPRYGFDAVRVPLYLAWARHPSADLLDPFHRFWTRQPVPAWIDLVTGETAPYPWLTGMKAISLAAAGQEDDWPVPTAADGYYSSSLALLSRIAANEVGK